MESLARISNMLETARDLTLEAAQSASASGRRKDLLGSGGLKSTVVQETRRLLNSRMDREVLEGLKRVIEALSRGHDCSEFFADVIKNVASPVLSIKKLVYIYLLHYAESEPDLALLSINTIQKSLADQNPLVRAMAIRVMSGIRVPVISQIVALAIKKCVTDMSPYVRKSAALAIPKCYRLDPGTKNMLVEILGVLLGDRSYYVVGAAVVAYWEICPERWDLIHTRFRVLCGMMVEMDEWGQLAVLRLLTLYARKCFTQQGQQPKAKKGGKGGKAEETAITATPDGGYVIDPDLEFFLSKCTLLLHSRNSAVITAIASAFHHLSPPPPLPSNYPYLGLISGPLVSLLRSPPDIAHIALINIVAIALVHPRLFAPYALTHFLIQPAVEPVHIWKLKMEALTIVFPWLTNDGRRVVLTELEYFANGGSSGSAERELVRESVRAIGRCAAAAEGQGGGKIAKRCLGVLLRLVTTTTTGASATGAGGGGSVVVAEAVTVIRHILQAQASTKGSKGESYANMVVIKLAQALDTTTNPQARASIIWLVGEFAGYGYPEDDDGEDDGSGDGNIAADTLRILAKGFVDESEQVRGMIVLLAAKVYVVWLNRRQLRMKNQASRNPPPPPRVPPISSGFGGIGDGGSEAGDDDDEEEEEEEEDDPEAENHPIPLLQKYILHLLSRYDISYDLRDRARLYRSLLADPKSTQLATLILQAPKPKPLATTTTATATGAAGWGGGCTIGSASLAIGVLVGEGEVRGYNPLPEWSDVVVGRDERHSSGGGGGGHGGSDVDEGAAMAFGGGRVGGKSGGVGGGKGVGVKSSVSSQQYVNSSVAAAGVRSTPPPPPPPPVETLDEWLASSDDDEEDDSSEEESEEESEDEEEDEDDDEDEDEDEDDEESGNEKSAMLTK
ncbi:AP-3 adaptor complex subunit beta [Peziza echinospora]|nr:AP-3 adaptor complex subunit beta [Peziza echinospora]